MIDEYKRHLENEVLKFTPEQRERISKAIEEWKYLLFRPELEDIPIYESRCCPPNSNIDHKNYREYPDIFYPTK